MNVRRGLTRIGIILWVFYAGWVAWYPIHDDIRRRQEAYNLTGEVLQGCLRYADNSDCWPKYEQGMKKDKELYPIGSLWTESGWNLLWLLPTALFVPPVVLYGIIWALVKIVLWVASGFRRPSAPGPSVVTGNHT